MQNYSLTIFSLILLISSAEARPSFPPKTDLRTISEKSGFKITGRADESENLCHAFAKSYPSQVTCDSFGTTPEGRKLMYLTVSENAHAKKRAPAIWIQAGIHSGEIDGKDAMYLLIREILEKKISPNPLQGLTLVFIPIFNLDGHERFGKWNRPNQVGPTEMGWRTTAQNLNLNRDFTKADAPEMQALLKLWNHFDPVVSADLHVTDGANFQNEVGIIVTPSDTGDGTLKGQGKLLSDSLQAAMKARGHLSVAFYPEFEKEDEPLSGFSRGISPPRFSDSYWYNRNRIGILVETHSWKDYANRVRSQHDTVLSILEKAQANSQAWLQQTIAAEKKAETENLADQTVALTYTHTDKSHVIDFPAYHFTQEKSAISGATAIQYHPDQLETWKVPYFDELTPKDSVHAPKLGYFIRPAYAAMVKAKLDLHGIQSEVLTAQKIKTIDAAIETFRASKTEFGAISFEGHQSLKATGAWKEEMRALTPGTLFVPIAQKNARMVLQLLEPTAPDSLLQWGFFNSAFEEKEYMETYVTEDIAKVMMKDPVIAQEFNDRLKNDADFAKSPAKRLAFFYEKHPSYDHQFNLYPVYRK